MSDAGSETAKPKERAAVALDRAHSRILVVLAKSTSSTQFRSVLKSLGFTQISAAASHVQGLDRAKVRSFTHVIFDAKATDMPVTDFVQQMMKIEETCTMIAVSEEPRIDDVFGILKVGARGFLVPPYTIDIIEEVLIKATEGPPFNEGVLSAPDRNSAFVSVILNNLDKLAVAMRHSREFVTAQREARALDSQFRDSIEMGYLFREGSDDIFRTKLVDACIARSQDAATRLGRLRKKLAKGRSQEEVEEEERAAAAQNATRSS